jgi:sugar phosphate permease
MKVKMVGRTDTVVLWLVAVCVKAYRDKHAVLNLQILSGVVQSTGWPGVVTVIGNWFGRRKRGERMCCYVQVKVNLTVNGYHFRS